MVEVDKDDLEVLTLLSASWSARITSMRLSGAGVVYLPHTSALLIAKGHSACLAVSIAPIRRQREGDCYKFSLVYIARPCLKTNRNHLAQSLALQGPSGTLGRQ